MSNPKEENQIELRLKEIYECTQHAGFKHIEDMFKEKLLELKSIDTILSFPEEDRLKMITLQSEVALRLQEILTQITVAVSSHTTQVVDEIRVYGADDFGGEDLV